MKNNLGEEMYSLSKKLWPYNRSITGEGVRSTFNDLKKEIPGLKTYEIPTGAKAFDWTIPKEWRVNDAYIICPDGKKICEFKKNNLHLVSYSRPVKISMNLKGLQKRLFSLPKKKNAIPYVTSYYHENWGFCISHNQRKKLKNGTYKVVVDSKLFKGSLTYGEIILKGKSKKEIIISTYICHPSMGNNELSGPVVTTYLVKFLKNLKNRYYTYRIVFVPETIGSIFYIKRNFKKLKQNVIGGFNVSCVGDDRTYSYVPSRNGYTISDKFALHVLKNIYPTFKKFSWLDRGSDERQYCSPGVDLPICSILRSKYGNYPEYHTSDDNLKKVVSAKGLYGGYKAIQLALSIFENNFKYKVTNLCEPQLSKYNLRSKIGALKFSKNDKIISDLLSLCDGHFSVLEIAEYLNIPAWNIFKLIEILLNKNLIKRI